MERSGLGPLCAAYFCFFVGFYVFPLRFSFGIPGDFVFFVFEFWVILGNCSGRLSRLFWPPRAPGWPETDSPRKMIANSGVETKIGALGTRFVATFRL